VTNRRLRSSAGFAVASAALTVSALCLQARAAEHITLRNGFELDCARREAVGDRVRIYLLLSSPAGTPSQPAEADTNYIEVSASAILRAETIPEPLPAPAPDRVATPIQSPAAVLSSRAVSEVEGRKAHASPEAASLTPAEMHEMLARAGSRNHVDADLLAAVVHAESGGKADAVSRAGAQGLMQLMPATASELGVGNSFAPEENIGGGSAYLDQLLTRYHDNIALALAAYNAGPAAVDRYHGIPPFVETRAYVARVIREFNRRKRAAIIASAATTIASAK